MFKLIFKILDKIKAFFGALGVFGIVVFYLLILGLFIGYFINIYKLVTFALHHPVVDWTLMLVLRIVGVFIGLLGGILGWL